MQRLAIVLVVLSVDGAILWMTSREGLPSYALPLGLIAIITNVLLGVRLGYNSARRYFQDIARVNRCLSDQNEELTTSNRELLERLSELTNVSPTPGDSELAEFDRERAQGRRRGA